MLEEIFYWLFNMSIAASVTGIFILLLRKIRKIPRRLIFFLWSIPFLRMWIPVGLGSKYSLMSLISRFTTRTVVLQELGNGSSLTMTNFAMAANSYFPIAYKENLLEDIFRITSIIWIIIAVAFLLAFSILYVTTQRALKHSVLLRDNIYLSDKLQSPAAYGIIRPRIILPTDYRDKELFYILLHENAHIKRGDNLWRIVAFATASIHWFNPFAWIFLKYFLADIELSCDEIVLARCGEDQKKEYALTLVNCAKSKNIFASAFGGAKIRVRIDNILSYQKISIVSAVFFAAIAIAITYVLLTNAL